MVKCDFEQSLGNWSFVFTLLRRPLYLDTLINWKIPNAFSRNEGTVSP